MAVPDHILQEDGVGKFMLEDGSGHIIQETSTTNVDPTAATSSGNSRQRMAVIQMLNKRKPRRRARRR